MNAYDAVARAEFPPRFEIFCAGHFALLYFLQILYGSRDAADVTARRAAT